MVRSFFTCISVRVQLDRLFHPMRCSLKFLGHSSFWIWSNLFNYDDNVVWDQSSLATPLFCGWWLITLHSNITWLTLTHSLDGSGGKIKTLTLYSDPTITLTTTITQTTTKTLTLMRNSTFSLKWPCHVMSRDRCSFLPITCQGSISTLRHVGWFGISVQKYVDLS